MKLSQHYSTGYCQKLALTLLHGCVCCCCSKEDEFELAWEKQVLIHMDDAMRVPKTKGVYNTVAHHFYEASHTHSGFLAV